MSLKANLQEFPGLSHQAFQHPLDRQAMIALEKVPLLPQGVSFVSSAFFERLLHIEHISDNTRVTAQQYPSLYRQYLKLAAVLDVKRLPDLYIDTTPTVNAYATGIQNYFIVLNSGLIDILTEDELLAILGHELGHVKCEHMLYTTLAQFLRDYGVDILNQFVPVGLGALAGQGLQLALMEWYRKAEFSCDRAALIATQNVESICSALAKLAGYAKNLDGALNLEEIMRQANDYQEIGAESKVEKVLKLYVLLNKTHPYPVVRVKEIRQWSESTEYAQILAGNYKQLVAQATRPSGMQPLATPTGVKCTNPKCGRVWSPGTGFCGKCSTNLRNAPTVCGNCFVVVKASWANCVACGNALNGNLIANQIRG